MIDLTDPDTFEMWHDQFVNALSGSATDHAKVDEVIGYADRLAQAAVALIQKRAGREEALNALLPSPRVSDTLISWTVPQETP